MSQNIVLDQQFDTIYRNYYAQLFRFAFQYVRDEEECYDIVSGAFEQLWLHLMRHPIDNIRAFLFTVVKNRSIDSLRRMKRHEKYVAFADLLMGEYVEEQGYEKDNYNKLLIEKVLETLPSPPTREILVACYLEEKKYREVAEEMGITVATVKKHMVKALKIIRSLKDSLFKA